MISGHQDQSNSGYNILYGYVRFAEDISRYLRFVSQLGTFARSNSIKLTINLVRKHEQMLNARDVLVRFMLDLTTSVMNRTAAAPITSCTSSFAE